jgi:hypothetical protein
MDMDVTTEPASKGAGSHFGPIAQFAIKTAIVCAAIIVSGFIMLDYLDDFATRRIEQMDAAIRPLTKLGGKQFWSRLEDELDRQADPQSDLSPEKKRKILSQIKIISDRWRPFLSEASSSIAGDANPPAKQ